MLEKRPTMGPPRLTTAGPRLTPQLRGGILFEDINGGQHVLLELHYLDARQLDVMWRDMTPLHEMMPKDKKHSVAMMPDRATAILHVVHDVAPTLQTLHEVVRLIRGRELDNIQVLDDPLYAQRLDAWEERMLGAHAFNIFGREWLQFQAAHHTAFTQGDFSGRRV